MPGSTPTITAFAIPTAASRPANITLGPDGNLWFVEYQSSKIGRITPAGDIAEFSIPTENCYPERIRLPGPANRPTPPKSWWGTWGAPHSPH